MLHELEKELSQVQNSLMKKEMELEKQQRMTTELESTIQEVKQDKSRAECGALRAEIQKLKDNLEEAQQQQKLAGEAPSRRCSPPHFKPSLGARAVPPLSLNGHFLLLSPLLTADLVMISWHISQGSQRLPKLLYSPLTGKVNC